MKCFHVLSAVLLTLLAVGCASSRMQVASNSLAELPKTNLLEEISSISPADSAQEVSTLSEIKINFKKSNLNIKTSPQTIVMFSSPNEGRVSYKIKTGKGKFCLEHPDTLKSNTEYLVMIANLAYANLTDQDSIWLRGAITLNFKTRKK